MSADPGSSNLRGVARVQSEAVKVGGGQRRPEEIKPFLQTECALMSGRTYASTQVQIRQAAIPRIGCRNKCG